MRSRASDVFSMMVLVLGILLMGSTNAFGQVSVSVPDVDVNPSDTVSVPVSVSDLTGESVTSYDFALQYDASVVEVVDVVRGEVTTGGQFFPNTSNTGRVSVAFASGEPLSGSGSLAILRVRAVDGGSTPLGFSNFQFNEGQPAEQTTDGSVTVAETFVSVPDTVAQVGQTVDLPVRTSDLSGLGVNSYNLDLSFNPNLLTVEEVVTEGTLSEGLTVESQATDGVLSVAVASGQTIEGEGDLFQVRATVRGSGSSELALDSFEYNEGTPSVSTTNGSIRTGDISVTVPEERVPTGQAEVVEVTTTDLAGRGVFAFEFDLNYDPAIISISDTSIVTEGTLSEGSQTQVNVQNGTVSVAVSSGSSLSGEGVLFGIRVQALASGQSPLEFANFVFNEGQPSAVLTSGRVVSFVNVPPSFTQVPSDTSANVNEQLELSIGASDVNGDDVSFSLFNAPENATIDSTSGDFTWTPTLGQADSTYQIGVRASDRFATSDTSFAVTVRNAAPQITQVPADTTIGPNADYTAQVEATDPNGDPVEFGFGQSPDGMAIDSSATVTWTPTLAQSDSTYAVEVFATDTRDSTRASFAVTVGNDAPQFTQVPADTTIEPKTTLSVTFIAQDPNDDAVSYVLSDAPSGATIDGNSGVFEWTPTLAQSDSTYSIQVSATDSRDTTSVSYSVDVMTGTARAQFIHNAADPSAETVDVYFDDELQLDDFSFREATPFVDVPAGTEIDVGVAPGNSESVSDTLASFPVTFAEDATYTVVANGVLDPTNFADNPSGEDIGFEFFIDATAREEATSADSLDVRAVHGATDAPVVDIGVNGTTLFDDIVYGDISDYITAAPAALRLVVTPGDSDATVASFQADLSALGGQAATVLASGFLNPAPNQNGSAFALIAVLADGTVVPFPVNEPPTFTTVPGDLTATPGQTVETQIAAEDPDDEPVFFTISDGPSGAEIDSTSGVFSFTPTASQAGSAFDVVVRASDGVATADTSFAITVRSLDRDPITVDISQSFGDATDDTNYRLVGLPGQVDLPIENTLTGDQPSDWRAFWDNGGGSTIEQGLVEFDGSSLFNFRPGRGFWLLAKNPWVVSQTFPPVDLNDDATVDVTLHDGWNIISNPLGKDVNWSAVQSENGISVPLWTLNGSFTQSGTFASAGNGRAYYVLNEDGLNELSIPFFGSGSNAVAKSTSQEAQILKLSAVQNKKTVSNVWVGMRPDAKDGRDEYDHFSPPAYFTDASLALDNDKITSRHTLASDVRTAGADGHTFSLVLTAEPGTPLQMQVSGLSELPPEQEVRLYDTSTGQSFDLQSNPVAQITPQSKRTEYALVVGKSSYVADQEANLVPQKLALQQNYPNPFRGRTTVEYSLPEQTEVRVEVYDILGRRIRTLVDGESQRAGVHTVQWNAQNDLGRPVASGVYLTRLQAGDETRTIKMVVIK